VPNLNTARGAIDTTDLGVTLMHEHVFIMTTESVQNYPEAWGHYLHIHNDAIPALKERGVTDEQLTTMLVDKPRKIFENQGAYW
jgi:predicted metal-dependent phosphotriesterase family hydrolase